MRRYLALTKGNYLAYTAYRGGFFFTFLGNILYVVLLYFLWSSIYANTPSINNMTFEQVFTYLTLAYALFIVLRTWTDWDISQQIIGGRIAVELTKPLDYQLQRFFNSLGGSLANFIFVTLPSILLIVLVFNISLPVSINLLFFLPALCMSLGLSFIIDYMVGLTSFYTQSIWGVSMTKEVVVTVFAGTLIPLPFFPEGLRDILELLPFQAIYHVPLTLLTDPALSLADAFALLLTQLIWVVILIGLSRAFYAQASKALTVNGG